jgi:rRNA-processing protein FCF1
MKIKQNILTVQGGNEAEIALETEVKEVFNGSPYKGYCVLGALEKLAKKVKGRFLSKDQIDALMKKHKKAIDAQEHFTEEGVDFFVRIRKDYKYPTDDSELKELGDALLKAEEALEKRQQQLINEGRAKASIKKILECHGEAKK